MESKKFLLQEKDIPTAWYNIVADMENKPLPPLNPKTKEPLKPEDLYPLFAKGLVDQEMNQTDAWIEIPEEVRDMYKIWRPDCWSALTDLKKHSTRRLTSTSRTKSVSPVGSHKSEFRYSAGLFLQKGRRDQCHDRNRRRTMGSFHGYGRQHFGLELAAQVW